MASGKRAALEQFVPSGRVLFLSGILQLCSNYYEDDRLIFFVSVACFFFKILPERRKFGHNKDKTVLWESLKNQLGRPKEKRSTQFSNLFWKSAPPPPPPPPPPRESPRSAPGLGIRVCQTSNPFFLEIFFRWRCNMGWILQLLEIERRGVERVFGYFSL